MSQVPVATGALGDVVALSPDNIWAVGWRDTDRDLTLPLALHWDGTRWRDIPVPGEGGLVSIAAASPSSIWAVGGLVLDRGLYLPARSVRALSIHWDGHRWRELTAASPGGGGGVYLSSVAARRNATWTVGWFQGSSDQPVIWRWNGVEWDSSKLSGLPWDNGRLFAVAISPTREIWAVGDQEGADYGLYVLTGRRCPP